MTPHPLDTAAMRHYRRWMAKDNRTQAETSLRRMLAREANLPAAHSALARLRWPGPDYRAWLDGKLTELHHTLKQDSAARAAQAVLEVAEHG